MATGPFRTVMRRLALDQIRHVTPVRPGDAGGLTAGVYGQVERDFGVLAPPVALHSPAPEVLAASWLMLREILLVQGLVSRATKEAVASVVSLGNECPYCVSVHSATLHSLVHGGAAKAIAKDRLDSLDDPETRAAAVWAKTGAFRDTAETQRAPFPIEQTPEYIGVALTFQYLNRMVNVFLETAPMPSYTPRQGLPMVKKVLSTMIRGASHGVGQPGVSLEFLPAAPLPDDVGWAAGNPEIADAVARAGAAIERAGQRSVPKQVRDLVLAELDTWDGRSKGLSRSWVELAVGRLNPAQRPAGRLALLAAFASYQVDDSVIEGYRLDRPDDAGLIELVSWSSLAAARRAVGWLPIGGRPPVRPALADDLTAP